MKQTALNKPTKEQLTAAFAHAWGKDKGMIEYRVKYTDTLETKVFIAKL